MVRIIPYCFHANQQHRVHLWRTAKIHARLFDHHSEFGVHQIILGTCSLIHTTQDDISRRTRRSSERMMEQWVWSAQHLLYVFKTFFADFRPFTKESGEWPADTAHLDSTQAAYLHNVTRATGSRPTPLPSSTIRNNVCTAVDSLTCHPEAFFGSRRSIADVRDFNYQMVWGCELFEAAGFVHRKPSSEPGDQRQCT